MIAARSGIALVHGSFFTDLATGTASMVTCVRKLLRLQRRTAAAADGYPLLLANEGYNADFAALTGHSMTCHNRSEI